MSVRSMQARVNPVYLTAKTAVCLMEQAGIPGADKIVHALNLENHAPLQNMTDAETVLGNALVVEAKYRTMCRLIEASGYQTCVDLPCGYTPKAILLGITLDETKGLQNTVSPMEEQPFALQYTQENCSSPIVFSGAKAKVKEILQQKGLGEVDYVSFSPARHF